MGCLGMAKREEPNVLWDLDRLDLDLNARVQS